MYVGRTLSRTGLRYLMVDEEVESREAGERHDVHDDEVQPRDVDAGVDLMNQFRS
jgi:hypothetical protein